MKNLKIAFLVLLAAVLMASCTQVKIVDMIPGGDKEETPVSDLPKIIDPETILRDAADVAEGLSYTVETSNEPFASRAAGDDAAAPVYYQMVVTFRGYKSSYGIINRGTLTFDFTDNEGNLSYVANGNGLVVASNTEVRTRRTDAEGLEGTVKGFAFTDKGTVLVTADYNVKVNPYKGSFTSGRDKVTIAESKGVVSGGNGTADSPFIISNLKTLEDINEFGDNVSIQLGADFTDLDAPIEITTNNIVLDLNEHTLENTNEKSVIEVNGGSLTIIGNGTVGTIRDASSNVSIYAARVFGDGTLIINGGSYYGDGGLASGIYNSTTQSNGHLIINDCYAESQEFCVAVYCASTLEVNGGKFYAKDNAVVGTNGSLLVSGEADYRGDYDPEYPAYEITINGGEFEGHIITSGYIANGIYMANKGTVTLNGGVFNITDGVGVLVRSGTLIANDVTINLAYEGIDPGEVGDSDVKVTADSQIVVDKLSINNYKGSYPYVLVNTTEYPTVDQDGQPYTGLDI